MELTPSENTRLAKVKSEYLQDVATESGLDSRQLWTAYLAACEKNGVQGSVGRCVGALKVKAKELRGT